jgi:hypothetical protein
MKIDFAAFRRWALFLLLLLAVYALGACRYFVRCLP